MDPASGVLVVLCGLPGAGKSTLARQLTTDARVEWIRFDDDLDEAMRGMMIEDAWHASRVSALGRVRSAVTKKEIVIADDNCYYRSMRHSLFQIARDAKFAFAIIFLDVPLEEALKRNALRTTKDRVPDATVTKMANLFEIPDPTKHPWERHSLISQNVDLPTAWRLVETALAAGPPPPKLTEDEVRELEAQRDQKRAETSASTSHNLDLTLRRLIGDVLKDSRLRNHKPASAKILASARKAALASPLDAALLSFVAAVKKSDTSLDDDLRLSTVVEDRLTTSQDEDYVGTR